ncbi:hypothetical protein HJG60_009851 [Phyllostomus discolor]|uniref:Uncharacterized protein n=1 Tax=Phyllostomus discolor TaxID=89673 RepID=A0A834B8C7_9CHIR|nr:hypothetical protein HJG60_009851 [Phyllostomus discolor]
MGTAVPTSLIGSEWGEVRSGCAPTAQHPAPRRASGYSGYLLLLIQRLQTLPDDACHCFSWDRRLRAGCIPRKVGVKILFPSDFPFQKLLVFSGKSTHLEQHSLEWCPSHPARMFSPQAEIRGV